jgi:hypothetical protein
MRTQVARSGPAIEAFDGRGERDCDDVGLLRALPHHARSRAVTPSTVSQRPCVHAEMEDVALTVSGWTLLWLR